MFDEFVRGIREYVSDRFLSPLSSSITAAWCLWNYKALIVILSGESAIRKIHLMHLVYQDPFYSVFHLVVGPLATAIFYIYVFPYPSNWVYSYSLRRRKEALERKREIEDQTPLTQEESRAIRERFDSMELEHASLALRLNGRIDSLKDQLKQAVEEKEDLLRKLTEAGAVRASSELSQDGVRVNRIELSKIQWRVLDALGRHGKEVAISTLSTELKLAEAGIWLVIGELEDYGLAYREDEDRDVGISAHAALTHDGLRIFMNSLG